MNYRMYSDVPSDFYKKPIKGSSPYLLDKLIKELDGARKILISFFLYNNPLLNDHLKKLSDQGCKIRVYSIPIQGFDDREKEIHKENGNSFSSSKKEFASQVYKEISFKENMELKIFPHSYLWYEQRYSRGSVSYSLHNKSIYAEYDGHSKCISSSCNFAAGDPPHSDNLLIMESDQSGDKRPTGVEKMFKHYFKLLDHHSIFLDDYNEEEQKYNNKNIDMYYKVSPTNLTDNYVSHYFTAPFVKYDGQGSNHYVQRKIVDFISQAKERVLVCTQHFSDYNSFDRSAGSIVEGLIKNVDKDTDIRIMKQTRGDNQAQPKRTREAERKLKSYPHIKMKYWNPVVHDKFIVVDDMVLVTTANFTSTQFAWDECREMKYNHNGETVAVRNTFSEVNSFHFIEDASLAQEYTEHFEKLWNHPKSQYC